MKEQPNILWIQTDEQRPDSLGCYGNAWAKTPNIDALAARGVCFQECHVQSPVCVPSRTSMLACSYPQDLGIFGNRVHYKNGILDPNLKMFPQILADEGYRTANIGKWHTPSHPTWQENLHIENFKDKADYYDFADKSLEPSHGVIKRPGSSPIIMAGTYPDGNTGHTPSSYITDLGIEWLRKAAQQKQPFLLRISHLWPHTPVLAPAPWDKMYDPETIPCRALNRKMYENRSRYERSMADSHRGFELTLQDWRRITACYYGLVSYVDDQVGRLLKAVDELGLRKNTLIAFNSDHGKNLGEYGTCDKMTFDREVWRVPFILSWPGVLPEGKKTSELNELIDFGPTLLSFAGLNRPANGRGRVLLNSQEPEAVFGVIGYGDEFDNNVVDKLKQGEVQRAAIRTKKWRYDYTVRLEGRDARPDEYDGTLIDIENDPLEEKNLINDPRQNATIRALQEKLRVWLKGTTSVSRSS